MLRAVCSDWWHTLAEPPADWEAFAKRMRVEGVRRVLRAHGIDCTVARLDVAYDLWTDHLANAWKRNVDLSAGQQILDLLASAGYDGHADRALIAALHEPIGAPLLARPPALRDGAVDALRTLKERGLRLALVSNTGRTWGHVLRRVQQRLGLDGVFDHRTFSDERRVRKPARAIFEHTLAALAVRPVEAVHVGDDPSADVAGARAIGMRAVWYDTGVRNAAPEADAIIHTWQELPDALRTW